MKELIYSAIVHDNCDYVFSNADLENQCPEEGDVENPGIKMTVEKCEIPEKFFSCFDYEICDEENLNFQEHFRQTLRGEPTPWKLTAVKIKHRFMRMTFHNEELHRLHCENAAASMSEEAGESDLPYYSENVVFAWTGKFGKFARLRFELERPNGAGTEAILVHFSTTECTQVTELSDNKRRRILLPGRELPILGDGYRLISITEHYR